MTNELESRLQQLFELKYIEEYMHGNEWTEAQWAVGHYEII